MARSGYLMTAKRKAAIKRWQAKGAAARKRMHGGVSSATKIKAMQHGIKTLKRRIPKASVFKRMGHEEAIYKLEKKIRNQANKMAKTKQVTPSWAELKRFQKMKKLGLV